MNEVQGRLLRSHCLVSTELNLSCCWVSPKSVCSSLPPAEGKNSLPFPRPADLGKPRLVPCLRLPAILALKVHYLPPPTLALQLCIAAPTAVTISREVNMLKGQSKSVLMYTPLFMATSHRFVQRLEVPDESVS